MAATGGMGNFSSKRREAWKGEVGFVMGDRKF